MRMTRPSHLCMGLTALPTANPLPPTPVRACLNIDRLHCVLAYMPFSGRLSVDRQVDLRNAGYLEWLEWPMYSWQPELTCAGEVELGNMAAPAPGAADFLPPQQPQPSPHAAAAAAAAAAGSKPAGSAAPGTPRASGQQAGHDEFVRSAQLGIYVDRRAPCCPRRQAGHGACKSAAAGWSASSYRAA